MKKKPEKAYKTISDFRKAMCGYGEKFKLADLNFYPCLECSGTGKVRDPIEFDSVEGYKMADWYPCKKCKDGNIGKEKFTKIWNDMQNKFKKNMNEWENEKEIYQKALSKLTKEEIKVLKEWFREE